MSVRESVPAVLQVRDLSKEFHAGARFFGKGKGSVKAVDQISFTLGKGEVLALVGESGCGKSTVGRSIAGLVKITNGEVFLNDTRIDNLSTAAFRAHRKRIQMVFQDPLASLNPRMKIGAILSEPLRNFSLASGRDRIEERVSSLLKVVGLPSDSTDRFPHEFSGGQRQRISIARALAVDPEIIICDEAVSALDVSVKAQIINLLEDLKEKFGLALIFISHDLAVVNHLADRVAVMYLGRIVEIGTREQIFNDPKHPYTKALLLSSLSPRVNEKRKIYTLSGELPSPFSPPPGCSFNTRCSMASDRCRADKPILRPIEDLHSVSCHFA